MSKVKQDQTTEVQQSRAEKLAAELKEAHTVSLVHPKKATLKDLNPSDKQKVANLIKQVVELEQEKNSIKKKNDEERQNCKKKLDKLRACNGDLVNENVTLKSKLVQLLSMVRMYQSKVEMMEATSKVFQTGCSQAQSTVINDSQPPNDDKVPGEHSAQSTRENSAITSSTPQTVPASCDTSCKDTAAGAGNKSCNDGASRVLHPLPATAAQVQEHVSCQPAVCSPVGQEQGHSSHAPDRIANNSSSAAAGLVQGSQAPKISPEITGNTAPQYTGNPLNAQSSQSTCPPSIGVQGAVSTTTPSLTPTEQHVGMANFLPSSYPGSTMHTQQSVPLNPWMQHCGQPSNCANNNSSMNATSGVFQQQQYAHCMPPASDNPMSKNASLNAGNLPASHVIHNASNTQQWIYSANGIVPANNPHGMQPVPVTQSMTIAAAGNPQQINPISASGAWHAPVFATPYPPHVYHPHPQAQNIFSFMPATSVAANSTVQAFSCSQNLDPRSTLAELHAHHSQGQPGPNLSSNQYGATNNHPSPDQSSNSQAVQRTQIPACIQSQSFDPYFAGSQCQPTSCQPSITKARSVPNDVVSKSASMNGSQNAIQPSAITFPPHQPIKPSAQQLNTHASSDGVNVALMPANCHVQSSNTSSDPDTIISPTYGIAHYKDHCPVQQRTHTTQDTMPSAKLDQRPRRNMGSNMSGGRAQAAEEPNPIASHQAHTLHAQPGPHTQAGNQSTETDNMPCTPHQAGRDIVAKAPFSSEIPVKEVTPDSIEHQPITPLVVATDDMARQLMKWQVKQGHMVSSNLPKSAAKVLKFDPAIGKHGAFYFVDIEGGAVPEHEVAESLATSLTARFDSVEDEQVSSNRSILSSSSRDTSQDPVDVAVAARLHTERGRLKPHSPTASSKTQQASSNKLHHPNSLPVRSEYPDERSHNSHNSNTGASSKLSLVSDDLFDDSLMELVMEVESLNDSTPSYQSGGQSISSMLSERNSLMRRPDRSRAVTQDTKWTHYDDDDGNDDDDDDDDYYDRADDNEDFERALTRDNKKSWTSMYDEYDLGI